MYILFRVSSARCSKRNAQLRTNLYCNAFGAYCTMPPLLVPQGRHVYRLVKSQLFTKFKMQHFTGKQFQKNHVGKTKELFCLPSTNFFVYITFKIQHRRGVALTSRQSRFAIFVAGVLPNIRFSQPARSQAQRPEHYKNQNIIACMLLR